jgi:hypothetical protein
MTSPGSPSKVNSSITQHLEQQSPSTPDPQHDQESLRSDRPIKKQNLTVSRYRNQYTGGTVPSFYRFRPITLKPLYGEAFS